MTVVICPGFRWGLWGHHAAAPSFLTVLGCAVSSPVVLLGLLPRKLEPSPPQGLTPAVSLCLLLSLFWTSILCLHLFLGFPSMPHSVFRALALPRVCLFYFNFKKIYTILKVTFHLQLLQNIGYIPHVGQYILGPILHPVVCACHPATPMCPPRTSVTTSLFSVSVSLLLFLLYSLVCCIF